MIITYILIACRTFNILLKFVFRNQVQTLKKRMWQKNDIWHNVWSEIFKLMKGKSFLINKFLKKKKISLEVFNKFIIFIQIVIVGWRMRQHFFFLTFLNCPWQNQTCDISWHDEIYKIFIVVIIQNHLSDNKMWTSWNSMWSPQ